MNAKLLGFLVLYVGRCALASSSNFAQPILNTSSSLGHLGHPDGFNFPTLGKLGNEVLFQGSFGSSSSALLVYGAHGNGLIDGVYNSSKYLGFGDASLAAGKASTSRLLAFVATTCCQPSGESIDSIILQASEFGSITIASSGQSFKPANVTLTSFSGPMVTESADGKVAHVAFLAEGLGWQGIILATLTLKASSQITPTLALVADTNTVMPGTSKLPFLCLGSQAVSSAGDVVFFGSHCGSSSSASSTVAAQRASQIMFRTKRKRAHSLAHAGDVFPGIFRWSAKVGLTVVADSATPVTIASTGVSETFEAFSNPAMGSDGTAAFVGETSAGTLGIFASSPSGKIVTVATTSTPVPGAAGEVFGDFPYVPSVGADGDVLFYASAAGAYSGVYSGTSHSGRNTEKIQAELTLADEVQNQPLVFIGFGSNAYSESSRVFATYLVLNNGVDGVWTFGRRADSHSEKPISI